MAGFSFKPEAPAGDAFEKNAPAGDAITSQQLIGTPLNQWDNIVKNGSAPNDPKSFQHNLQNELKRASSVTSRLNESYVGGIARGEFDGAIKGAKDGLDEFTEKRIPTAVKLDGYRELHHEIYGEAQKLNERFKTGDLDKAQLEQGIDQLMEYKDQRLDEIGQGYENKIDETMNAIMNKMDTPDPGNESDAKLGVAPEEAKAPLSQPGSSVEV